MNQMEINAEAQRTRKNAKNSIKFCDTPRSLRLCVLSSILKIGVNPCLSVVKVA